MDKRADLPFLHKCCVCGHRLTDGDIIALAQGVSRKAYHISCSKCQAASLVALSQNKKDVFALGMVTDMDKDEVMEKLSDKAISPDEIIDAYIMVNSDEDNFKIFNHRN